MRAAAVVALVGALLASLLTLPAAAQSDYVDIVPAFLRGETVWIEPSLDVGTVRSDLDAVVRDAAASELNLRVIIARADAPIDTANVRAGLGDVTVVLFTPKLYSFSSAEICEEALDAAETSVSDELFEDPEPVALAAFVEAVVAQPPCEDDGSFLGGGLPAWVWVLAALVLGAILAWTLAAAAAARRATQQASDFESRRDVLRDWALTLRRPITELHSPVSAAQSASLTSMYTDALGIARDAEAEVMGASSLPELDRAEMRIAKAQTLIRDLQGSLKSQSRLHS